MTEMTHAAELVAESWTWFVDHLALSGQAVFELPTRLAGWSVEDLARHVHWGMTLEADGISLARQAGTRTPDDGRRAHGRLLDGPASQVVPALGAARDSLVTGLRTVDLSDTSLVVPMPYGDVPGPLAMDIVVMESVMHRYDLAASLGDAGISTVEPWLPRRALGACAAVFQAFWPALATAGQPPEGHTVVSLEGPTVRMTAAWDGTSWGQPAGIADVGPRAVTVSGSDEDVVLFAYGRIGLAAADLRVGGDADVAAAFKELVPGP